MTFAESEGLGRRNCVISSAPYHQEPYIKIVIPCSGQRHSVLAATFITCKVPVCAEVAPSIQLQLPVWCQGLEVQTPTARFVSPFEGGGRSKERTFLFLVSGKTVNFTQWAQVFHNVEKHPPQNFKTHLSSAQSFCKSGDCFVTTHGTLAHCLR